MINQIQEIEIHELWGKFNYKWTLNPDVNILAGLNGSGKSSILQIIDAVFTRDTERLNVFGVKGFIKGEDFEFLFDKNNPIQGWEKRNFINISHFNIPLQDRKYIKDNASLLNVELDSLIFSHRPGRVSFSDLQTEAKLHPEKAEDFNRRTELLLETINQLFERTGKKIIIDPKFKVLSIYRDQDLLLHNQLSSGEKQMLIILFKVFLIDEQSSILLLDEPENSLHIEWQQQLIDVIRKLNSKSQIILSTHSPSIFGEGWGDKLFFLEDMIL
ncbi:MAG: AAA family ATPase [Bacteroidota bacterium]|nr:AAA family ATPase [Bacteroidota bacterium]